MSRRTGKRCRKCHRKSSSDGCYSARSNSSSRVSQAVRMQRKVVTTPGAAGTSNGQVRPNKRVNCMQSCTVRFFRLLCLSFNLYDEYSIHLSLSQSPPLLLEGGCALSFASFAFFCNSSLITVCALLLLQALVVVALVPGGAARRRRPGPWVRRTSGSGCSFSSSAAKRC